MFDAERLAIERVRCDGERFYSFGVDLASRVEDAVATGADMVAVMEAMQRDIDAMLSDQLMMVAASMAEPRRFDPEARKRAESKGLELLKSWLSPEQLKSYDENRFFEVIGGKTGRRYRIRHGAVQNVYALDAKGEPKHGLCFAPQGNLVAGDVMLAQKLALECNEFAAIEVANLFPISREGARFVEFYQGFVGRYDGVVIVDEVAAWP